MGSKWAWNLFLPTTLSDTDMVDIPTPRTELFIHVTYKSVQVGTILGMGVFGPIIALIGRWPFVATCMRSGLVGALIGIPGGPVLTQMTLNKTKSTNEMVWDRCYRLRYCRNQVRVDRSCTYGAIGVGALATATAFATPVNGVILGIFFSTIGAGIYNYCGIIKEESIVNPRKKTKIESEKS